MDFGLSTEQRALRERYRSLGAEHWGSGGPAVTECPHQDESWRLLGESGFLGLCAPRDLGGSGLGALDTVMAVEGFGEGCANTGLGFAACAHLFAVVRPIVEMGSDQMKRELVPRMVSGELVGANAITEEEAGSDVYALQMTAELQGDTYILNGQKSYVTNGPESDVVVVYATTNPAHGYMGVTGFAVDCDQDGIHAGESMRRPGMRGASAGIMTFDNVAVPASRRLGEEGQGGYIFARSMAWERGCLFGLYVGMMQRQLDQSIAFARKRKQFRKKIGKFQAISHRIADMKMRLESARLLLYRACWLHDTGADATMDISLSKLAISESAIKSSLDMIQIHGSRGYMSDSGIDQGLRDALPSTMFSGTSEIHRNLIAQRLGL